ncbi:FAD-dependent oxidoreductase [Lysinibacillus yapensis]|nr:FAD-dependent oxidoreductase [Lysinibacillus yapensis]
MEKFDAIIIGFGKAGKTLAGFLAKKNWKVALIEKDAAMYGGTCINIACIPTKTIRHDALNGKPYTDSIERKTNVVEKLRDNNFNNLNNLDQVTVFNGFASFVKDHVLAVELEDKTIEITSDHIFINTGSQTAVPPIEGVDLPGVYTSTTLLDEQQLPKSLAIIGGGYIGLEYASIYRRFGAIVTVIVSGESVLLHEDEEIREAAIKEMQNQGIQFVNNAHAEKIEEGLIVHCSNGEKVEAEAVLIATGRKPNIKKLGLENTSIEVKDGAIVVDEHLQTTVPNTFALGDVRGDFQFTYTSLDDFRIVKSKLFEEGSYTSASRGEVPYSLFIDPPFARIGLTMKQAQEKGLSVLEGKVDLKTHPYNHVTDDLRGLFKVVVNAENKQILGASLFGAQSPELVNMIKLAMDAKVPFTHLRDQVYTHPTMSEVFNNLFDVK